MQSQLLTLVSSLNELQKWSSFRFPDLIIVFRWQTDGVCVCRSVITFLLIMESAASQGEWLGPGHSLLRRHVVCIEHAGLATEPGALLSVAFHWNFIIV
jgi:hypothetical protein